MDRVESKENKGRSLLILAKTEASTGYLDPNSLTFALFSVFLFMQIVCGQMSFILQCAIPTMMEVRVGVRTK